MTIQSRPKPQRFTADEFIEWAMAQSTGRFELVRGEIVAMSPERLGHTRVKYESLFVLRAAIAAAGLDCEAIGDGISLRIDDAIIYEPDAIVRCGPKASSEVIALDDPIIVVEVVSPSSGGVDTGVKLADYFRLPSVRHYLVIQPEARAVTHHRRDDAGAIATRILTEGALALDPPGIEIEIADLFATL